MDIHLLNDGLRESEPVSVGVGNNENESCPSSSGGVCRPNEVDVRGDVSICTLLCESSMAESLDIASKTFSMRPTDSNSGAKLFSIAPIVRTSGGIADTTFGLDSVAPPEAESITTEVPVPGIVAIRKTLSPALEANAMLAEDETAGDSWLWAEGYRIGVEPAS